jgi:hypothetical protein
MYTFSEIVILVFLFGLLWLAYRQRYNAKMATKNTAIMGAFAVVLILAWKLGGAVGVLAIAALVLLGIFLPKR